MENQETNIETNFESIYPSISNQSRAYLMEMTSWAKFFAILSFIGIGLIAIGALFAGMIFGSLNELSEIGGAESMGGFATISSYFGSLFSIIYLAIAVLYFFPSIYLYRFSDRLRSGLQQNNEALIENGFKNLKSVFKFWGIYTIVIIGFYILILFGSVFI